jgi:hypothetical protein
MRVPKLAGIDGICGNGGLEKSDGNTGEERSEGT